MTLHTQWSRRNFITAIAGAGGAIMLNPLKGWAIDDVDPTVARIVAATMGIDTHNHVDVPLDTAEVPGAKIALAKELKASGLAAICMTFAVDYKQPLAPGESYQRFKNGMASMDKQLALNGMTRSLTVADLTAAHKQRQPTVIQSVEGGHFLEGQIERLAEAYSLGLRHLTLLHDNDASVPLGDVFTNPPRWGGLTTFGAAVIRECNKSGILVDLGHADNNTVNAALKIATQPVIISHTGLDTQVGQNQRMASMMRPRLISKEQAGIVAQQGGIIGVWTHLSDTPLEYAQHIRAMVDIVGIDHVCIGTDTKLTPAYRSPLDPGPKPPPPPPPWANNPADNKQEHREEQHAPGGPGNNQNHKRAGERTNEAWADQKAGFYYAVVDALLQTGFNADEIGKIGGGNFCRVFGVAVAGRH